jgi:hypothetical protein
MENKYIYLVVGIIPYEGLDTISVHGSKEEAKRFISIYEMENIDYALYFKFEIREIEIGKKGDISDYFREDGII